MKLKQLTLTLLTSTLILTACNGGVGSGGSKNDQYSYSSFASAYSKALKQATQSVDLNLYNSIFISPNQSYKYEVRNLSGQLASGSTSTGSLKCTSIGNCLISGINVEKNGSYLVSISNDSDGSFVGGAPLFIKNAVTYMDVTIDDASTSSYISQIIQGQLKDMFSIAQVENRLFKPAMDFKPNVALPNIIYAYYLHLAQSKGHDTAMQVMSDQYKKCEQENICNIDPDFIKNPQSVEDALNAVNNAVEQYGKDKNDSKLYEQYKWFKENVRDNFDASKDAGKAGIDFFFPGVGGKVVDGAGTVFDIIEKGFNFAGLDDSKSAYDRLQIFNTNLSKYYTAAIPNYAEILNQLSAELLLLQLRKDFNEKNNYANSLVTSVNNNLQGKDIVEYIDSIPKESAKNALKWITSVWGQETVLTRLNNSKYISDLENISALAKAYTTKIAIDPKNNINNIQNRKYYNQLMMSHLQDSIEGLQASMYLDSIAIMMRDKHPDFKNAMDPTQVFVSSITLTGIYDTDISKLRSFYSGRLNMLKDAYQSAMLAEKANVAQNVLQTLEVEGKCDITATDGLNTLSARCPVYTQENGNIVTKYIASTIEKDKQQCLSVNGDASGNITEIGDVRNIYGKIGCETNDIQNFQYDGITKFLDDGTSRFYGMNSEIPNAKILRFKSFYPMQIAIEKSGYIFNQSYTVSSNSSDIAARIRYIQKDNLGNTTPRNLTFNRVFSLISSFGGSTVYKVNLTIGSLNYKNTEGVINTFDRTVSASDLLIKIDNPNVAPSDDLPASPLIPSECNIISQTPVTLSFGIGKQTKLKCGTEEVSRVLLDGGLYEYDTQTKELIMTNWGIWEKSAKNKYASNNASLINQVKISDVYAGSGRDISCSDNNDSKNQLINEGRKEFANSYENCSATTTGIFDKEHQVSFIFPSTRLPVPVKFDFNGTQRVNIWKNNSQGRYTFGLYGSDSVWDDPLYSNYNYSQRDANIRGGWTDHQTGQLRVEYR